MENKIKNAGAKHGAGACTARAASFSSDFRLCRWSLIGAVFILACLSAGVYAGDGAHPFKPGEKLKYVLKWGVISAGEAELAVLPEAAVLRGRSAGPAPGLLPPAACGHRASSAFRMQAAGRSDASATKESPQDGHCCILLRS